MINRPTYRRISGLALTALAVGALLACRIVRDRQERQHLLRRGEIRELRSLWHNVMGIRMHARCSLMPMRRRRVPVVMVHGWGISSSYQIPTAERLARDFDVFAPDLPGHGLSDAPSQPLDIPGLSRALVGWMDSAGIAKAALVGHSLGCQVAVDAALRHPERVTCLVLIGPPDPAGRSTFVQFMRFLRGVVHERLSLAVPAIKDFLRVGRRLVPEYQSMIRDPIERKLAGLTVPVMLVRGEKDAIAPQPWMEQAARLAGTRRTAVIPEWGHAVQYSAPAELTETIRPFLSSNT